MDDAGERGGLPTGLCIGCAGGRHGGVGAGPFFGGAPKLFCVNSEQL